VVSNAGVWLVESNYTLAFYYGGPQPQFHNSGTFRKTAGNGATSVSGWGFANSGTVEVQTGTLQFDGVSGVLGAAWTTAGGTEIRFNSGTYTNTGDASFTGLGLSRFLGSTLWLTGAQAPAGLRLEGGTVLPAAGFQGGAITNLTIHGATLLTTGSVSTVTGWLVASNGAFSGTLTIAAGGQLVLAGSGAKTFSTLRLVNQGTVRWLDGSIQADYLAPLTVVSNAGVWLVESNHSLAFYYGGPQPQFHNSGTFRKTAGNGTTSVSGWGFANSGTVEVQTGTLQFDTPPALLAGSLLHLANASLTFSQPQVLAGRLQGRGTINGTVTNAGVIAPTNTGTLTLMGSYSQDTGPGPRLEFSLGGTSPGTNYSVFRVNGTVQTGNPIVDGSLVVKLVGGFVPALGNRFDFLTAGTLVAGPASNVTAIPATFQVQTNATRLSLVTIATGPAAPALTILRLAEGVRVLWPDSPGYLLQTTTNLNTVPGSWAPVPGSPNPYDIIPTEPQRFFRLIKP
jgi:hypothetical protein